MNITPSRFVTVPVSDQERAKDFYVRNRFVLAAPAPAGF